MHYAGLDIKKRALIDLLFVGVGAIQLYRHSVSDDDSQSVDDSLTTTFIDFWLISHGVFAALEGLFYDALAYCCGWGGYSNRNARRSNSSSSPSFSSSSSSQSPQSTKEHAGESEMARLV
jgi:hypothetical protein